MTNPLRDPLTGSSQDDFYTALAMISPQDYSGHSGVLSFLELVDHLDEASLLTNRVKAQRLGALLNRVKLDAADLDKLAARAHHMSPGLRNTIAAHISPLQRRRLLSVGSPVEREAPTEPEPTIEHLKSATPKSSENEARCTAVIILSKLQQQDANKHLLRGSGFGPVILTSIESMRGDLEKNGDVCSVVVDQSFLADFEEDMQEELFRIISAYSTFAWIRIQEGKNLKLTRDSIRKLFRATRQSSVLPAECVSFQPESSLSHRELEDIQRASEILRSNERATLVPGDLSAAQIQLIVAAAQCHVEETQADGATVKVESLETRILPGGRSGAIVLSIRINGVGRPIIAKLSSKDRVIDEIRRFRVFVAPDNSDLSPRAHFHGKDAVILFGLVSDMDSPNRAAPMLLDKLQDLWNDQLFGAFDDSVLAERADHLVHALSATARTVRNMNIRRAVQSDGVVALSPSLEHLDRLNVDWGLPKGALTARGKAAERHSRLAGLATVHGDIHLGNVLLRQPGDAHLIDYAGSGPGHPADDLVRLELLLYAQAAHQVESEDTCVALQRALSVDLDKPSHFEEEFPAFYRCHVNVACMRGCIAARDEARAVLHAYSGDKRDYQAAKYLIAWQYLGVPRVQTALARAVLLALTPELLLW